MLKGNPSIKGAINNFSWIFKAKKLQLDNVVFSNFVALGEAAKWLQQKETSWKNWMGTSGVIISMQNKNKGYNMCTQVNTKWLTHCFERFVHGGYNPISHSKKS